MPRFALASCQIGLGDRDIFLPATFKSLAVLFLSGPKSRLRPLQGGAGQIAILRRNRIFSEQTLGAIVVQLLLLRVGLGIDHVLLRSFDLLLARAGQSQGEV